MPSVHITETANADGVIYFRDGVSVSDTTYTYDNPQSQFTLTNTGTRNIIFSVGSLTNITVIPGDTYDTGVLPSGISSFTIRAQYGYQSFTMDSIEVAVDRPTLTSLSEQLADIATNVKLFGAKGDGVTDDTQAIQNAINFVASQNFGSSSGGKVYFPSGQYIISTTLNVFATNNIQLVSGYGASVKLKDNSPLNFSSTMLFIKDSSNIKIDNLEFNGNRDNQPNGYSGGILNQSNICMHAMQIQNCSQIEIKNNYFHDVVHAAIKVNSSDATTNNVGVNQLRVLDNYFYNVYETCQVTQSKSENILFNQNYCENIGEHGFTTYFGVNHVIVSDNIIKNTGMSTDGTSYGGSGIRVFECLHATITGNIIFNPKYDGIMVNENNPASLTDNNQITITGNTVLGSRLGNGISVQNGRNITITGNTIKDLTNNQSVNQCGILVAKGTNITISGNLVENTISFGISIGSIGLVSQLILQSNTLLNNSYGVYLYTNNVSNALIANHMIYATNNSLLVGIYISSGVSGVELITNKIWGFTQYNIRDYGTNTKYVKAFYRSSTLPTAYAQWLQGDYIENPSAAQGGQRGWVCTTSGTSGTLSGVTGTIAAGSTALTVNTLTGLNLGDSLLINASFQRTIVSIDTTNKIVTLNASISSALTNAPVSYYNATWQPFGQVGYMNSISAIPNFIGQIAVVSGIAYIATGTSANTDWKQIS